MVVQIRPTSPPMSSGKHGLNDLMMAPEENRGEIIIYRADDNTIQLDVRMEHETVWLTQKQIAELFDVKRPAITKHLRNIFNEGELDANSVSSILEHTAADGRATKTDIPTEKHSVKE